MKRGVATAILALAMLALAPALEPIALSTAGGQSTSETEHRWTYKGKSFGEGEEFSELYEGFVSFITPSPPLPVGSAFGCELAVVILVKGTASETGNGLFMAPQPTTKECVGTGIFEGCELDYDQSNAPWEIDISEGSLTVIGPITITYDFVGCFPKGIELSFSEIWATTVKGPNGISTIDISGTASNGVTKLVGELHWEELEYLGVDY